jgi:outer membrane protein assembly factor BamD (BamD/ComL family)
MRPKPNRLIAAAFSVALSLAAGCQKRVPVAVLPPVSAPAPAPLDQADRAFTSGNYDDAAREYEDYLRLTPSGGLRDQALFRLGLTYALRSAPAADWARASSSLKQLMAEFPNSSFRPAARLILSLHSEMDQVKSDSKQRDERIKQLTTELDRLKKIDADRRKSP